VKVFLKLIGDLTKAKLNGILIYIPSYFDYLTVRNKLESEDVKFVTVNEYTERSEVKRCRQMFESDEVPIMLFTERRYV